MSRVPTGSTLLCHTPRPGYYVLWMERASGFVAMFPLCESCARRPDKPLQLAYAMQRRLHPEDESILAPGPAGGNSRGLPLHLDIHGTPEQI